MAEEMKRDFATIGNVYEDGVSLIFDGETEESEKHYLVNTTCVFAAGDRVRIIETSGTYVVEYVVGIPTGGVHGVPTGGTTGQVLAKTAGTDYAVGWANAGLPTGGSNGQFLKKTSSGAQWADVGSETIADVSRYAKVWGINLNTSSATPAWDLPQGVKNAPSYAVSNLIQFRVSGSKLQWRLNNSAWTDT